MQEIDRIIEITKGKSLKDFDQDDITVCMLVAAIKYHHNGWKEIPDEKWNKKVAYLAVRTDFIALNDVPEDFKSVCSRPFAAAGNNVTRRNVESYRTILNKQSDDFIKSVIKHNIKCIRFLNQNKGELIKQSEDVYNSVKKMDSERTPIKPSDIVVPDKLSDYNFSSVPQISDKNECTAEAFLILPVEEKTQEKLLNILTCPDLFPINFIKELSIPNRNAQYYEENGDHETAEYWKNKIIPYLGKNICISIAAAHPEASIETPMYLQKEHVKEFWNRIREKMTKTEMTDFFLKFPENVLSDYMIEDITVNSKVICHAPDMFLNQEATKKFLDRNPAEVLNLPESFQEEYRILRLGVPITKKTISLIKNESLREKIKIAFKI